MRLYLPATLDLLASWVQEGRIPAGAEAFTAVDEDEESEYVALEEASEASALLLEGPGRRVVVVAETPEADAPIDLSHLAAVHADTDVVDPSAADLPDLGWFAVQELGDLVGGATD